MIKIAQLISKNGTTVKNQFVHWDDKKIIFKSYETIICHVEGNKITLDPKWDYSQTTTKYLCQFLERYASFSDMNKGRVQKMIESGEFTVKNLN